MSLAIRKTYRVPGISPSCTLSTVDEYLSNSTQNVSMKLLHASYAAWKVRRPPIQYFPDVTFSMYESVYILDKSHAFNRPVTSICRSFEINRQVSVI